MQSAWSWRTLCLLGCLSVSACFRAMVTEDIEAASRGDTFDRMGDYRIGPADILNIKVFGEEAMSGPYTVAPSGMIQFPLVGFVGAQGLSQFQLAASLERALRPYIKQPRVVVSISDAQSFQVYMAGEIKTSGALEMRAKTTMLQGIAMAGGLTDFASGKVYLIRRTADGSVKRYATTYGDLLRGRKMLDFFYMERGDLIYAE